MLPSGFESPARFAADSLGAAKIGRYGFEAARRWVDDSILVPDDAIRAAQQRLWREARIASEPAPAPTLAALLTGAYRPEPSERVGLVVSGGNTNPGDLASGSSSDGMRMPQG